MKKILLASALLSACMSHADEIKHRFIAADEAGHRIVFIDEKNPTNDWEISTKDKGRAWDMQLIGDDKIAVSYAGGYHVLDLNKEWLETHRIKGKDGVDWGNWSTRICEDGKKRTIGFVKNLCLYIADLDENDAVIKKANVPETKNMRLGRITAEGNGIAAPGDELVEWDVNGNIIKRFNLPHKIAYKNGLMSFMGLKDADGNYWAATGYGKITLKMDSEGNLLQSLVKTELFLHDRISADANGNLVQCNWSGHSLDKATKGVQLVEFNPKGKLFGNISILKN